MTTTENHGIFTQEQVQSTRAQLSRILESEFFRSSDRCSKFLEYSVQKVIDGCPREEIKERIIGAEVFHRLPGYDTSQDNIVRVTATDVRKRLAQYYSIAPATKNPVIDLHPGSYAVTLHWKPAELGLQVHTSHWAAQEPIELERATPVPAGRRTGRALLWAVGVLAALAVPTVAFFVHRASHNDVLREVWSPLLESQKPILICIALPDFNTQKPQPEHVPASASTVGLGDAAALAEIAGFLGSQGKSWRLLAGYETPSGDLRSGPLVLIGAYSNPWTMKMTANLRFVFPPYPETAVLDRSGTGREWKLSEVSSEGEAAEDYAVVSRFLSPETGEPVIVVAGINNPGTQAAGEFVASKEMMAAALRNAPKDWRGKNFQFVLHSKVISNTPEHPTVIASYFW
jgi:hypothetical protein